MSNLPERSSGEDASHAAVSLMLAPEFAPFIRSIEYGELGGELPNTSIFYVEPGLARIRLSFHLAEDIRQDDWRVTIRPAFAPTFHWSPHLTPTADHVVDQHSFRSPALIAGDSERLLTIIPDPDAMLAMPETSASGAADSPRWYMDLDAPRSELTLGLSATAVREHVLYVRRPGAVFPAGELEFGFYARVSTEADDLANPWREALAFLWEGWGGKLYRSGEPLRGSLEPYAKYAYEWAFRGWQDAIWQSIDLGDRKVGAPVFIVNVTQSPNYPGEASEREFRSVWNQAWFSSLRSAQGLFRFGQRTGNKSYMERARQTKELALAAPQSGGFFPSVLAAEMESVEEDGRKINRAKGWHTYYWGNSNRNPFTGVVKDAPLHILDMSWTALQMLRWHEELEPDGRLLDYAVRYGDALLRLQDERGFFPGWIDEKTHKPCGVLDDSPETSMSVTFLLKLYRITGNEMYHTAALQAIDAVAQHVVPLGRWEDFETYYSCCPFGREEWIGRKIERNNMYKQCNFSMFWTAEALLDSYVTSGDSAYLQLGRRCLDELLMTQASWQPPYIFVPAVGGFGVMNADGEWNDARQSLFAETIIRYGLELGVEEYVERGIAALRVSFALMYCPENPAAKGRWEHAWPFFGEEDYGFMMENYGHGGRTSADDDYMGEFTIYDWGNGAAAESYLRLVAHYGEAFLDRVGVERG
ncbi:hypothetical protein [Paenibacillus glycanilyticus]|uniref:Uncharacterized protein n=1 Tax=Paenibacillus glycanilyticus TaxID=126569 RepID=A0ABQ6G8B8_9BACL|nr:hypothetical protein [Paenibacillus glycanilyticus]GLX65781.1 hypothetical protein MU1_01250 [Paenibacillus glycanilyticus]